MTARTVRRRGDETFAFPGGEQAVVSVLCYRKTARLEGNALVPCVPEESDAQT